MSLQDERIRRLKKEQRDLRAHVIPGVAIEWAKDLSMIIVTIPGPEESYYEGDTFKFQFIFQDRYPKEPPVVKCLTRIYHPNIDVKGGVCVNGITTCYFEDNSISKMIKEIIDALQHPNPILKLALNPEACKMLNTDKEQFRQICQQYIYENNKSSGF